MQKFDEFFNPEHVKGTEDEKNDIYLKKKSLYEDGIHDNDNFIKNNIELHEEMNEDLK